MKIQTLMVAVTLAAAGSAFAADTGTAAPAAAQAGATAAASDSSADAAAKPKKTHKKVSKKKHAARHARAHHGNTHAMGAGPGAPMTDIQAPSRQARMDQAYANWQAARR